MLCPAWVVSYFLHGAWSYLRKNKISIHAFFVMHVQTLRVLLEND